jgi:hypothetical protein
VLTVHDLRNPHHPDPAPHAAALDVLVPAAAALITLTPGAAAEIGHRWGRAAHVVPHPHVVPLDRPRPPRPARDGLVVGVHAKSLRANTDPVGTTRALARCLADVPGGRVRFDAHDDPAGRRAADRVRGLPGVDVRVHRRFTDEELWRYLEGLDLSVLPYRWGTHSGWLEACHDLGVPALVPRLGHYAEQAPCLTYGLDGDRAREDDVRAALRAVHRGRPRWTADPDARRRQRAGIAEAHARVYAQVRAGRDAAAVPR